MDEIEIRQLCANILDGSAAVSDGSAAYDSDPMPIIRELLPWLSSADGYLRDELVYESLCALFEQATFTRENLSRILAECLSECYLFRGLPATEENNTENDAENDDVFARSFSLLVIDLVLDYCKRELVLSEDVLHQAWVRFVQYVSQERDLRGYVDGKGWAHALAHGSDVATSFVELGVPSIEEFEELLAIWQQKIADGRHVYIDGELERIQRAVLAALKTKLLSERDVCDFVNTFVQVPVSSDYPVGQYGVENIENFCMRLLIHAKEQGFSVLEDTVFQALQTLKHRSNAWW